MPPAPPAKGDPNVEIRREVRVTEDNAQIAVALAEGLAELTETDQRELYESTENLWAYTRAVSERLAFGTATADALEGSLSDLLVENSLDPATFRASSPKAARKVVTYAAALVALESQSLLATRDSVVNARGTALMAVFDIFASDPENELEFLAAERAQATGSDIGTVAKAALDMREFRLKAKTYLALERSKIRARSLGGRARDRLRSLFPRGSDEATDGTAEHP